MSNKDKFYPGFNDENLDRDKRMREDLKGEVSKDDLSYNAESDSFEIDVNSEDEDYDHPDPYNTAAKNGTDFDSDYDEANLTAVDEYRRVNDDIEPEIEEYGMHIDSGKIAKLSDADEALARTPEDDRDDLDEEGYPKNDAADQDDNEYLK
ncbi:hypothetical protein BDE36_4100 [Arcticibacter tournemirensis]|uniref:Uncharacterized protein n=1 Tax=Arcticibacter tournemirensis TaxID=699437 RepID=A0A5M9GMY9_9SPHI|nr:hypothetical protein [Arcticibacter tournemirensis]KAA8475700.1 hypothetical protein F1649_21125 [Arcticibacter tournemirensis]TQM52295.1 hypothetical protein BDE36_4100 [Arcticibacter tournemirensis]